MSKIVSFLSIVCFGLLCCLVFLNLTPATTFFANDQSTDFIIAKLFFSGDLVLLGPPSHVGGRHPGPIYYWYVAAIYWLADKDLFLANIIFAVTKLIGILFVLYIVSELTKKEVRRWSTLFAILILFNLEYVEIFRMQWQSHYLFLSSSFAFFTAFLFVKYGWQCFLLFALGGSTLFHSHLSSSPILAGLGVMTAFVLIFRRNKFEVIESNRLKKLLNIIPIILLIIIWTPVVLNDLWYHSNFKLLFNLHSDQSTEKAGVIIAISYLVKFFSEFILGSKDSLTKLGTYAAFFYGLTAAVLALYLLRNRSWKISVFILPVIVAVIAVATFRVPIYVHYYNSLVILPVVIFAVLGSYSVYLLKTQKNFIVNIFSICFLCLLIYQTYLNINKSISVYQKSRYHDFHTLLNAQEVAKLIEQDAKGKNIRLFTKQASKYNKNSYYYFMEGEYYRYMEYKDFFHELDAFNDEKDQIKPETGYLISCPRPYNRHRLHSIKAIGGGNWEEERLLDLSSCTTCSNCAVSVLKKKKS